MGKIFHQLTWDDRIVIDTMERDGKSEKEIAERVGVHISTIYREQKRGRYTHKNSDWTTVERYSPDIWFEISRDAEVIKKRVCSVLGTNTDGRKGILGL
jgi:IS30 family transposase